MAGEQRKEEPINESRRRLGVFFAILGVTVLFFTLPNSFANKDFFILLLWCHAAGLLGLGYRLFETRYSPEPCGIAFLFSYQIRLFVADVLLATTGTYIINANNLSEIVVFGCSASLMFIIGRNPELGKVFELLKKIS